MAVPKRRTAKSRTGMRRSHHHLDPMDVRYCPRCEQPVRPHHVCGECGWYKGREIVAVKTTEK